MIATEVNGQYSAIDLFCGAGGVTCGLEQLDEVKVITAINHSKEAIEAKGVHLGKSETLRKKHIGNAVPPKMAKVLVQAFLDGNRDRKYIAI